MARTVSFGPVGIAIPAAAGTGGNDKRVPLNQYEEAYLTSVYAVLVASQGPVFCLMAFKTASQIIAALGEPGFIRSDANFGGSDGWYFEGKIGLSSQGNNEVVPFLRNDTAAAVTVSVGGTLLIVRD